MKEQIKKLVELATALDSKGLTKEADDVDRIVKFIKAEVAVRKGRYTTVSVDDKGDHAIFSISVEPFSALASIEDAEIEVAWLIEAIDSSIGKIQNLGNQAPKV